MEVLTINKARVVEEWNLLHKMEVLHLGPALFVSVVDEDDEVEEKEQDHLRALDLGTMEAMNNFDEEVEADLQIHAWMMNIE